MLSRFALITLALIPLCATPVAAQSPPFSPEMCDTTPVDPYNNGTFAIYCARVVGRGCTIGGTCWGQPTVVVPAPILPTWEPTLELQDACQVADRLTVSPDKFRLCLPVWGWEAARYGKPRLFEVGHRYKNKWGDVILVVAVFPGVDGIERVVDANDTIILNDGSVLWKETK